MEKRVQCKVSSTSICTEVLGCFTGEMKEWKGECLELEQSQGSEKSQKIEMQAFMHVKLIWVCWCASKWGSHHFRVWETGALSSGADWTQQETMWSALCFLRPFKGIQARSVQGCSFERSETILVFVQIFRGRGWSLVQKRPQWYLTR